MPTFALRLVAVLIVVAMAVGSYFFLTRPDGEPTSPSEPTTIAIVPEPESPAAVAVVPSSATPLPPSATPIPPTETPVPTATQQPPRISEFQAMDKYANQSFTSLEEMPADLRRFYQDTFREVAVFFQIQETDLMALVQQQSGGQFRLPLPEGETTSLVPANLWNGPGTPPGTTYLTNLQRIEQAGGMGFAWTQRHQWQAWIQGRGATTLTEITSDPYRFTNGVAALGRYLAAEGVTSTLAATDGTLHQQQLVAAMDGIAAATSRTALAAPAPDPAGNDWTLALQRILDERLGIALPTGEALALIDSRGIAGRSANPGDGAAILYTEMMQDWLAQGRAASGENRPLSWPYVQDDTDVAIQEVAVRVLGHALTAPDIRMLRDREQDSLERIEESLAMRYEAVMYAETRSVMDSALQRSARGMPLWNYEVSALVQSAIEVASNGNFNSTMSSGSSRSRTRTQIRLRSEVQYFLRRLPEYRAIHGDQFFSATPFDPMPSMGQPFGSPVDYQAGGVHTGVDIRARGGGEATLIRAVEAGTVAHVGPLFCLSDSACRGPYAVVLHHGNNVYTIYSHNSEAFVAPGDTVVAGQAIARQGSEGYSRGPHLHLELHVGAPYSGVWSDPWRGGQYIDPWPWLPKEGDGIVRGT
jgi:hypothetical protein